MQHYPGPRNPLVHFLCDAPYWSVFDKAALDNAIGQLPDPFPGPGPPVLGGPYPTMWHMIVYDMSDIVYDI